ncbi:unnamed protein product [Calypogeia fissa]
MRFGAPWELVSDRSLHFINKVIETIIEQHQIRHRLTTPYNPKANGLTKRANGIMCTILTKVISAHKSDWDRKLASAVYAYNIAEKSTTGKSPYFLVYGQNPLSVMELELETDRTIEEHPRLEELLDTRLAMIEELDEERKMALERTEIVQQQRKRRFDKKIKHDPVEARDQVLMYDRRHQKFPGKLHVRWLGPFQVTYAFENGSLSLATLDVEELPTRVNGSRVRRYYDLRHFFKDSSWE